MRNLRITLFLCYVCIISAYCTRDLKYPYSVFLDRNKALQLSWRVSYRHNVVYFHLTASVTPGAWFGVGFSDYGEPEHADMVVFWTDADREHHFQVMSLSVKRCLHLAFVTTSQSRGIAGTFIYIPRSADEVFISPAALFVCKENPVIHKHCGGYD